MLKGMVTFALPSQETQFSNFESGNKIHLYLYPFAPGGPCDFLLRALRLSPASPAPPANPPPPRRRRRQQDIALQEAFERLKLAKSKDDGASVVSL